MLIQLLLFIHSSALTSTELTSSATSVASEHFWMSNGLAKSLLDHPNSRTNSRHYNLPRVASHSWPCSRVHWVIVCTLSHASCYYRPFPLLRETKCRTLTPNLTLFLTYSQHEPRPRFFFSRLDVNLDSLSFHLRF